MGNATYSGIVAGTADVMEFDYLYGVGVPASASGTVLLNFDFGAGTLGGSMSLSISHFSGSVPVGTYNFTDTVYSIGSMTYSGRFQTAVGGINYFLGRFTGPSGDETIGAWALPFHFSGDGQNHQAMGAWIAKKP